MKRVADLDEDELDYWVATALELPVMRDPTMWWSHHLKYCHYSTEWYYGGPIIESWGINLHFTGSQWSAARCLDGPWHSGETPLIAAMRSFVAHHFGFQVEERATDKMSSAGNSDNAEAK